MDFFTIDKTILLSLMMCAIWADFFSAILRDWILKVPIKSLKMRITIGKIYFYYIPACMLALVEKFYKAFPFASTGVIVGFILIELYSMIENGVKAGFKFPNALIRMVKGAEDEKAS